MIDPSQFLKDHGEKFPKPSAEKPKPSLGAAYRFAIRSLGAAGASEKRMAERMERKGFAREESQEAIEELKRLGLIDDFALAEGIVEKCASNMEGELLIRLRLRRSAVSPQAASRALLEGRGKIEEGERKFFSFMAQECAGDAKKALKLCKKKGQPLGLALKVGASYTPGSVAP